MKQNRFIIFLTIILIPMSVVSALPLQSYNNMFDCFGCQDVWLGNGELTISKNYNSIPGPTYLWTKEHMYDFSKDSKLIVEFDAYIEGDQEIIIAFSANRGAWGEQWADALTIRVGYTNKWRAIVVRRKMFDANAIASIGTNLLNGMWYNYKIILKRNTIELYIDGSQQLLQYISNGDLPQSGYIGIVSFETPQDISIGKTSYRNFHVTRETKLF